MDEVKIPSSIVENLELHYKACDMASKKAPGSGCWDTECRYAVYDFLTKPNLRNHLTVNKMFAFDAKGSRALISACNKILKAYKKGQELLNSLS